VFADPVAVLVGHEALAVGQSVVELAVIGWLIGGRVEDDAPALSFVVLVLALVPQPVIVVVVALAVLEPVVELPIVGPSRFQQGALPVEFLVFKGPIVLITPIFPTVDAPHFLAVAV